MESFQIFLDLGQFLLVTALAFVVLVLIASHLRFQALVSEAKKEEGQSIDPHAAFELRIAHLLGTVHRVPEPFCVILAVPQNFEELIQSYGEATAGEILESIKLRFRENLRSSDMVSVYHYNRIGAILDAERGHARQILQRLVKLTSSEHYKCRSGLVLPIKIAMGLVSYPENGDRIQSLLENAEQSLSRAMEEESGWHILSGGTESGEEVDVPAEAQRSGEAKLIDPLTGLLKSSRVGPAVQKYIARYRRQHEPASMLLMEIDHLDRYVEHYGDEAKAEIFKNMGRFLQQALRETDLLARLGDEEFLVVMNSTPSDAQLAGQRLVNQIRRTPFTVRGSNLRIALSIGVAGYPDHGGIPKHLLECADMALNFVRENGRGMCLKYESRMNTATATSYQTDVF